MSQALDLEKLSERANEAVGEYGLERSAAMLAEGFCPACVKRSATEPILPDFTPDTEERTVLATVNCAGCQILWRTGTNPDNNLPWIDHTRGWNGMYMTMGLNPPREPEPEEDGWDEEG